MGAEKNAPIPDKKALDAGRPRVPVTLWLTNKPSKTQKRRGPTLRARGAPLALTRARGGRDHPLPTSARSPTRASRKGVAAKQNKTGKKNKDKRSTAKPLPPRVPRKGPQKGRVPGESQKRAGPRMAPREKRQEAGRTAKKGETTSAAGNKKRKGTRKRCV